MPYNNRTPYDIKETDEFISLPYKRKFFTIRKRQDKPNDFIYARNNFFENIIRSFIIT
jgi:hypothetical protein